ncbi:uncharacterized protein HD556DRAFT_1450951 [Suillus plorans]|uniref:SEC63 domain-containing protein n=1 Tax=Suillus plorans TaxID=116603 RepID=A0A9P7A9X5_9AGAM|nr:uncharacterized protein HD556DRAFT_1450951 [Suillus plorans]KAG1785200.1 hypothetical protein HD556DRAFT_1450951 [Suillus plorans]
MFEARVIKVSGIGVEITQARANTLEDGSLLYVDARMWSQLTCSCRSQVVIKGTQFYDSAKRSFVDLSVLDVLQVFGRAFQPCFEASGEGYICTAEDKLMHYLNAVTSQNPIESHVSLTLVDVQQQFDQIQVRVSEVKELDLLMNAKGGKDTSQGKANILLQSCISRLPVEDFALISDAAYAAQNGGHKGFHGQFNLKAEIIYGLENSREEYPPAELVSMLQ